jgi:hypothetical protein
VTRSLKDILAGLAFVAFGAAFAFLAVGYRIGTPGQMGPGAFPFVVGGILIVLGAVMAVRGFVGGGELDPIGIIPWRAIGLILAAVVFFGLTVRGLGLVPSTFGTAILASLASRRASFRGVLAVSIGLTIVAILVFVVALSLNLRLIGPWIPV